MQVRALRIIRITASGKDLPLRNVDLEPIFDPRVSAVHQINVFRGYRFSRLMRKIPRFRIGNEQLEWTGKPNRVTFPDPSARNQAKSSMAFYRTFLHLPPGNTVDLPRRP